MIETIIIRRVILLSSVASVIRTDQSEHEIQSGTHSMVAWCKRRHLVPIDRIIVEKGFHFVRDLFD